MNAKDIILAARTRLDEAIEGDRENRKEGLDDLKMLSGDQWDETEESLRVAAKRPVITINRLPQFVRQVTGDIRKLNPAVKVLPADQNASKSVAMLNEGLIRQIEYSSDASAVYEGSAESAAQCGIGNWRIRADYEDEDSFNQEIKIERIFNPFAVYWDPSAREPTRADANYCFITDQMDAKEFERAYPKADRDDVGYDGETDGMQHWSAEGEVVVAEYYWKQPKKVTIYQLADGSVTEEKPGESVKTRVTERQQVMWAKVSGTAILEGPKEIPCKHIPVVAVVGEEMHAGDRIVRTSVIRFAKDPQKVYNYASSTQTEVVAMQPKAPYIGTLKQFNGLENIWKQANTSTLPFLPYNPDEKAPGRPQRETPPVASQGLSQEIMRASEDMKSTTGIFDAGLGNRSNENSGVAIRQRQMESDVSTSIYTDNLAKSIAHSGRIMVDMIPKIYDTHRVLRIVGDDDQEQMVEVNGAQIYGPDGGVIPPLKLQGGKYDVRVSVGPNYTTRRQETQEGMMQFVQSFPQAGALAGDLIAKAMDWPDAEKLANRLKKGLPPGVIGPDEMDEEEQQGALVEAQQIIQQLQQQIEAMAQAPEMRKAEAEATEAEAQAQEAGFDAMLKQIEVSAQSGAINAAISNAVQQTLLASQQTGFAPQ